MSDFKELQNKIGYTFQNEQLLKHALAHSSYINEHRGELPGSNERLEFLGDAVLELISAEFLFTHYQHLPEGTLTKMRALLVCETALFDYSKEFN
ncbi:MAG: ribonuclease III, partial [Clostridia bacterium]|nr:ribonuclease III [Clostridia bacterium]